MIHSGVAMFLLLGFNIFYDGACEELIFFSNMSVLLKLLVGQLVIVYVCVKVLK